MIRAFLVVTGLVMVATQKTPFDLTGVHISHSAPMELTLCVLVMIAGLASSND